MNRNDPEPERYYDWMLWKMRQEEHHNRRNDEKRNEEMYKLEIAKNWSKKTRN